jgi:Tripartite tricarboxylate transporter family receptor
MQCLPNRQFSALLRGRQAVTSDTRLEALPDIPTLNEFVPGYEASQWYGMGAPRNTPLSACGSDFMECRGLGSFHLDGRELDNLAPLLGFLGDELSEVGG